MNGLTGQTPEVDPAVLRERLRQLLAGVGFGGETSLAGLLRALVSGGGLPGSTSGLGGNPGGGIGTFPPTIEGTPATGGTVV